MALQAGVLALVAADQGVKALNDGIQQIGNGPNYLRDGQPESIPGIIGQEVGRSACRRYAEGDFDRLSDRASAGYEKACRPYLDSIAPGSGPGLVVPFQGGQCVQDYFVQYSYNTVNTDGSPGGTFTPEVGPLLGPIRGIERRGVPGNYIAVITSGDGVESVVNSSSAPQGGLENLKITQIFTSGGVPDTCGNPGPIVLPPTPIPAPEPGPRPFNPRPDINIDLDVTLNVDGSINFNIGVGVPILIRPNFDFSPDGSGDGGDGGGGEPPSPPAPEPGPELPGGNGGFGGDDGFGEPPAGRRWVGCCIRLTSYPLNQPPIPGSVPEDVFPQVVGNIRLVFNASGNRQTDTPVRITAKHVCVWEPVAKLNPVGVNVDLLPGFGYVYTPYSVPLE